MDEQNRNTSKVWVTINLSIHSVIRVIKVLSHKWSHWIFTTPGTEKRQIFYNHYCCATFQVYHEARNEMLNETVLHVATQHILRPPPGRRGLILHSTQESGHSQILHDFSVHTVSQPTHDLVRSHLRPLDILSPNDCGQLIPTKSFIPIIIVCQKKVNLSPVSLTPKCSILPLFEFSPHTTMPYGIFFLM